MYGDMILDLNAKKHFSQEIERKQRQIADLRLAINMNYKKITADGTLEGTLEGDMLIEDVENILKKLDLMDAECVDALAWINSYN